MEDAQTANHTLFQFQNLNESELSMQIPHDLLDAIFGLFAALIGWLTRGHIDKKRNGKNTDASDK